MPSAAAGVGRWRMPAEWVPHERTWMAFPREGLTLGESPTEAEEAYAAWTAVATPFVANPAERSPVVVTIDFDESVDAAALAARAAEANRWRLPEHFDADWNALLEFNADRPADPFKPYGATVGHGLEWARLFLHLEAAGAKGAGEA